MASADVGRTAAFVFIEILLILSFTTLNSRLQEAAIAEGHTPIEEIAALLFPYMMIFIILILGGVIIYELAESLKK